MGYRNPLLYHLGNECHDSKGEGFLCYCGCAFGVPYCIASRCLISYFEIALHECAGYPSHDLIVFPCGADSVLKVCGYRNCPGNILGE